FSQAIHSTKAVDAADGTVGTTGRFLVSGGDVAIAADSSSQIVHAQFTNSFGQTVVSKNGRLINSEVNLAWAHIIMAAIIERLIM
ncbi:MAG: hypothetical protein ACPGJW_11705, partial [Paracoccaceae bacterium]